MGGASYPLVAREELKLMANGRPTGMQLTALREVVRGRHVHDLGAGDCQLSWVLLQCGAAKVTAVDQERWPSWVGSHADGRAQKLPHLELVEKSFEQYASVVRTSQLDVVFLSWPVNRKVPGLLSLVSRARTIVYLGSNTDCNACGGPELLGYLLTWGIERYIAARANTLIVYGERLNHVREPTGEEAAGISQWEGAEVVRFEDAILNVPAGGVVDRSDG